MAKAKVMPKLQVRQFKKGKNIYLVYRYSDDKNKNFEYQTYKLIEHTEMLDDFNIYSRKEGRKSNLNSRERCDILWEQV